MRKAITWRESGVARRGLAIKAVKAFIFLLALMPLGMPHARPYSAYGRDIGCAEVPSGRARQICEAIAASLTWQWMGHAIVAPGYKPNVDGVLRVFCDLKIGRADTEALKGLTNYDPTQRWLPDWRLQSMAEMLLRIISGLTGTGDEPENSIFNPKNPNFVLKHGCP
jgi:hypothetical protein